MKAELRQQALALGFDDCRFTSAAAPASARHFQHWLERGYHGHMAYLERQAPRRLDPQLVLPGARTLIALAASYYRPDSPAASHPRPASTVVPMPPADPNPTSTPTSSPFRLPTTSTPSPASGVVARYARFSDYHDVLGARLRELADLINRLAGPHHHSRAYVDTGPILERDLAERAGLGFIGKHTNLIHRHFGNWVLLAEILTTLDIEPDPPERNRCGNCTRCLVACPTQALVAPFQLDARRCISYLTIELKGPIPIELRPAIGSRIFGCDDCLAVCPWNRFAQEGRALREHHRDDLDAPSLIELLSLDEPAFRRAFAGTPLERAKRRGLRRNVCVALGNVGDPTAVPALQRAAADPNSLVAEHAQWALERLHLHSRRHGSPPPTPTAQ
ncbi:MAG: tRNA epoxyqueuosine(34) reductase QueG [Verrucomicrobia bacterium]|nr:tRNA epoxyqueuosine(34) reductase QueG [Verrucomicrobiota bacterium]